LAPPVVALFLLLAAPAHAQAANQAAAPPSGNRQDAASVERRLQQAVRLAPASFDAHHNLGEFYIREGRLAEAIPHLEKAQVIDPSHYVNGYDLALAYLQDGRLAQARVQVQRLLQARDTAELRNLLGDVDEAAGNLLGAAEEYQLAAHMDPTEEHLFDWGNSVLQLRAYEPATRVFDAAIARYPRSARLRIGLAIAQYALGYYRDAVQSFCLAADLAPSDPRPYEFLGEMYGVSPELAEEVTRRLGQFVEAQPRNALARYYYAMNLWKGTRSADSVDLRRVEALLEEAVALDPTLAKGFLQLGILYADQRRYPAAIRAFRTATRLEPGQAQTHYRLAQAYRRTGQEALAVQELETFKRLKGPEAESPALPEKR
jgi:tetratricopeptide (TPR) repeat protein